VVEEDLLPAPSLSLAERNVAGRPHQRRGRSRTSGSRRSTSARNGRPPRIAPAETAVGHLDPGVGTAPVRVHDCVRQSPAAHTAREDPLNEEAAVRDQPPSDRVIVPLVDR